MIALRRLGALGAVTMLAFCGRLNAEPFVDATGAESSQLVEAAPVPLDPHMVFERVIVGADGVARSAPADEGGVAGAGERVIYSNTLGFNTINFPNNQPVSDDIATTAPNGCALKRYRFKVLGKVLPTGATGAFTVTYGLYTTCPLAAGSTNATRDLVRIPGTEGVLNFPDDGPRLIEHVVPAQTPVALPTNVYLSLRFNRSNCGTVIGAPAMIGYSGDVWDFPGFACNGFLGGFPKLPHASFWAEFYGSDTCADAFVAYKTEKPSGGQALIGANVQGVDDAKLIVNDCQMIGYEVAVKGVAFYNFDLRRECDGSIIAGTERTFQVNVSTVPLLQVARFNFDPPIPLTTDSVYLGFKSSSNSAGAILAGIPPIIGESSSDYFKATANGCEVVTPITGVFGAINAAISCAGKLPLGACCDPYLLECSGGPDDGKRCPANALCVGGADDGKDCSPNKPCASPGVCTPYCASPGTCEAVCRQATEVNCPFPPQGQELWPSWQAGKACEPDPFGRTHCGWGQCCGIRPNWQEVCDISTKNWCDAATPIESKTLWQLGNFCDTSCPHVDCIGAIGSCYITHPTPGCDDPSCCTKVCAIAGPAAAFCCNTAWDATCVSFAEIYCSQPPPNDQCDGALTIPMPGSKATSNIKATTSRHEPGFCCNNGAGACIGGSNAGDACIVNQNCASGVCGEQVPNPGGQGLGTIWFKFVQPIGQTSAGISTCTSNSPALDSIVQVFAATDYSSQLAACNSLVPIGCNDDTPNCGSTGRNSRVCLRNLTPGATYYIELAAKTPNRLGTYTVSISTSCSGTTTPCPIGACCDWVNTDPNGEAVCREVLENECPAVPGEKLPQWIESATCASNPFSIPCGIAACCHKEPSPLYPGFFDEVCENLTYGECQSAEPLDQPRQWEPGQICGIGAQACPRNHCLDQIPLCDPGVCPPYPCRPPDLFCCQEVCNSGPDGEYCCDVEWDSRCCELVEHLCRAGTNCPAGGVVFVKPPNGVVDAQRPYPPNHPETPEGIKTIVATGAAGATKDCWSICESPAVPTSIQITGVDEAPAGEYTIQLNRAITPGAVLMLTYRDNEGAKTVGRFVAHPGNVNGDSKTNSYDVLVLIDFLNGIRALPWGLYSGDLNHNGLVEPSDIVTLIDLLNGANGFAVWYGTQKPDAVGCP